MLVSLITLSSAFCLSGCANKTPYIGDNGNWWMDGSDLEIPATGPKGACFIDGIDSWCSANGRGGVRPALRIEL